MLFRRLPSIPAPIPNLPASATRPVTPSARFKAALGEFILPCDRVRAAAADPDAILVSIARNGEIKPAFLLDEPEAPRRGFDLGGGEHSHGLNSFSLVFDEPLSWPSFEQLMAVLAALRGSDLLRVKGLVAVAECRGPVVVHFVQHVAHPPIELEEWPDADRRSRLVFITRGLEREPVAQLFTFVTAVTTAGAVVPLAQ